MRYYVCIVAPHQILKHLTERGSNKTEASFGRVQRGPWTRSLMSRSVGRSSDRALLITLKGIPYLSSAFTLLTFCLVLRDLFKTVCFAAFKLESTYLENIWVAKNFTSMIKLFSIFNWSERKCKITINDDTNSDVFYQSIKLKPYIDKCSPDSMRFTGGGAYFRLQQC